MPSSRIVDWYGTEIRVQPVMASPGPMVSVFRLSYALAWLDEWIKSRTTIAGALA